MKKFIFLFAALVITMGLLLTGSVIFAQADSTLVVTAATYAAAHWPIAAKICAWCLTLSEVIALIPNSIIPANGIVDAIIKVLKWIGGSSSAAKS